MKKENKVKKILVVGMPVAPFFCRDKKDNVFISLNGAQINLKHLKKCRKTLNYLIDNLDKKTIKNINIELENEFNKEYETQMAEMEAIENKTKYFKQTGYIYLIKQDNYYKIGRAKEIKSRIKRYTTENPNPLKIILQIKVNDYVKTETELLQQYKKKQFRGEWFLLDNNDVKEIKNYLTELKQE